MATLVIAEHDNAVLNPATLNAVAAAAKLGAEVHVLVAGSASQAVAQAAAAVTGVAMMRISSWLICVILRAVVLLAEL